MMNLIEKKGKKNYKPIEPKSRRWPVVQLSRNRKEFINEVIQQSIEKIRREKDGSGEIREEIEAALYREKLRIKSNPWKVDPPDDYKYWEKIKNYLVELSNTSEKKPSVSEDELLRIIITRYANEISGNFKPSRYRLTRSIVKFGFSRLLNVSRVKGMFGIFKSAYTLNDKIQIFGKIGKLRKLAKEGTVVMVPTHFSNLDSILIGWIIHVLGLPPFIYGAGLNLFNIKIIAYFMNSLGAYKVDRRKKNYLYIETLKMYSHIALRKGAHSLFFPGGTRSRSGHIEKKLKRGLLGTAIEAQRSMLKDGIVSNKIYVVPVVLNYNFVFEAPALINEHLKITGQERYYKEKDEFSTSYRIIKFLIKFFSKGSNISVSIGKPMDVFGNFVNKNGDSINNHGKVIDIRDYFTTEGKIVEDSQREEEYTRMLSYKIVEEYHRSNRVFASHLAAFTAFRYWEEQYPRLDLFSFLRLPPEDLEIDLEVFKVEFEKRLQQVRQLKSEKRIKMASHLSKPIDDLIVFGINNLGLFHLKRPLMIRKGKVISQNLITLYYYHNRLDGYDFE